MSGSSAQVCGRRARYKESIGSAPGRRSYCGYRDIPHILGGLGVSILSTPQGIIDDKTARKNKLGGELLCSVW